MAWRVIIPLRTGRQEVVGNFESETTADRYAKQVRASGCVVGAGPEPRAWTCQGGWRSVVLWADERRAAFVQEVIPPTTLYADVPHRDRMVAECVAWDARRGVPPSTNADGQLLVHGHWVAAWRAALRFVGAA